MRSSPQVRSKIDISIDLLLLPAFCLFRRLLRRCLCFSLLRHCCPPSLSGWRYRCSAVANRRTLLPDYYSRKKITVTPLNIVCKCRVPLLRTSRSTALSKYPRKTFLVRAQTNTTESTHRENLDVMRVSRMRLFDCWCRAGAWRAGFVGVSEGGIIAYAAN